MTRDDLTKLASKTDGELAYLHTIHWDELSELRHRAYATDKLIETALADSDVRHENMKRDAVVVIRKQFDALRAQYEQKRKAHDMDRQELATIQGRCSGELKAKLHAAAVESKEVQDGLIADHKHQLALANDRIAILTRQLAAAHETINLVATLPEGQKLADKKRLDDLKAKREANLTENRNIDAEIVALIG